MMSAEQVEFAPPPLPPKTRRAPPEPTVLASSAADEFGHSFPEIQEGQHSQIRSSNAQDEKHVVKIRINPNERANVKSDSASVICELAPCIRISVNSEEMVHNGAMTEVAQERNNPYFYYAPFNCNVMSSGQVSPSDTLDSGTCSDLDITPPPLPKKKSAGVTVTLIGAQQIKSSSLTGSTGEGDSDNDSNISCDSLNSGDLQIESNEKLLDNTASAYLPQGLLKDIRDRSAKLTQSPETIGNDEEYEDDDSLDLQNLTIANKALPRVVIDQSSYQHRKDKEKEAKDNEILSNLLFDTDKFYDFHLNEHITEDDEIKKPTKKIDDETFAGYKDLLGCEGSKTIRSAKGTVRGVKNRVRAGIATFLQINSTGRTYKEKDAGKVVVYTTTMGIVRETYHACMKVKQILRTLLIKYEERDVFMSGEYQAEIRERMRCDHILVPQVFVDGQHVGDAETVERLNESGELRRILKPYKSMDVCTTCKACGGYRLLPCSVCNGSKKSVHRNHFTTEFVALKCMNCDEVGLVRCSSC